MMDDKEGQFIMPWGKHRGAKLHFLPSAYLYWLAVNAENMPLPKSKEIARLADEEWQYREKYCCHRGRPKYPNMED